MRLVRRRATSNESTALVAAKPPAAPVASDLDLQFREAYHRLHGPMLERAERALGDRDEACDAEAEAMANVWYRWPHLTPTQRTDKYFFRALRNCITDARRAKRGRVSLDDAEEELEVQTARAAEAPTRHDTAADVLDLTLALMPERRREAFLLVREQSFSYKEAADQLGLRAQTIHGHVRLAMKDLRAAFTQAGFRIAAIQPALLLAPKGDTKHD